MCGGLTCVVHHGGDAAGGPLEVVTGHTVVHLHSKRVVELRLQAADGHDGVAQGGGRRLKVHPLTARHAQGALAVLAGHAVGDVAASAQVQRGAPGQLKVTGRQ